MCAAVHRSNFGAQGLHEELHQEGDFFLGTPPVFRTEGKNREVLDPPVQAVANHFLEEFDAFHMAGDAGHQALARPTPVAIHDDRDMPRHFRSVRNAPGGAEKGQSHHIVGSA